MTDFGLFLLSEEHSAPVLLDTALAAEDSGLGAVWISDHFHPWLDSQGESPFVWCTVGAIAAKTSLRVTTGVTCPTYRIHPAIVAQAAATAATLLPERFTLGVGSGEALNEHILGDRWPPAPERLARLEEAIQVIRRLWSGEEVTHRGRYFTVENARLYSRPEEPPPIYVSGFGPKAIELAAAVGDGYINTSPDADALRRYRDGGGSGPAQAALKVCWADDRDTGVEQAHRLWRNSGIPGVLSQDLSTPSHFEQAASLVTLEQTSESVVAGPDPQPYLDAIGSYVDAGYDELYIAQIGPDQAGFLRFWEKELAPELGV